MLNFLTIFPYGVASRGKEVSATAPKAKDTTAAALDYVDIPHSQIRKVIIPIIINNLIKKEELR